MSSQSEDKLRLNELLAHDVTPGIEHKDSNPRFDEVDNRVDKIYYRELQMHYSFEITCDAISERSLKDLIRRATETIVAVYLPNANTGWFQKMEVFSRTRTFDSIYGIVFTYTFRDDATLPSERMSQPELLDLYQENVDESQMLTWMEDMIKAGIDDVIRAQHDERIKQTAVWAAKGVWKRIESEAFANINYSERIQKLRKEKEEEVERVREHMQERIREEGLEINDEDLPPEVVERVVEHLNDLHDSTRERSFFQ